MNTGAITSCHNKNNCFVMGPSQAAIMIQHTSFTHSHILCTLFAFICICTSSAKWVEQACPLPTNKVVLHKGPVLPLFQRSTATSMQTLQRWDCCAANDSPLVCYGNPRHADDDMISAENKNAYYGPTDLESSAILALNSKILPRQNMLRSFCRQAYTLSSTPCKYDSLLDIGSNKGWLLEAAAREGFSRAYGLEITPSYVAYSRRVFQNHTVFTTMNDLVGSGAMFDMVIAMHVFEHLTDPWGLLMPIVSRMKPGAFLVGEVPDACPGHASIGNNTHDVIVACAQPWVKSNRLYTLFAKVHTMYWYVKSLKYFLNSSNLKVLRIIQHGPRVDGTYKLMFFAKKL